MIFIIMVIITIITFMIIIIMIIIIMIMIIVREGEPAKHMTGRSPAIAPKAEGEGFVKTGF